MKNRIYKNTGDAELLTLTATAAKKEKEATLALLEYLAEIDLRKLYATKAYSSLFEYVVKELGMSEPAAAERVNAVRLMVQVPEVRNYLQEGRLTLTSAAQIQRFIKMEQKVRPKEDKIQPAEKSAVVDACLD